MLDFFRFVAEAIAQTGVKGLIEELQGGRFTYAVAEAVLRLYRERRREDELRNDLVEVIGLTSDQTAEKAAQATREVVASTPAWTADDIEIVEQYLAAIPPAVRASLRRPADPTGLTVPADFAVRSADDVIRLLPARLPRFRPGADLPQRPDWVLENCSGRVGLAKCGWLDTGTTRGRTVRRSSASTTPAGS